MSYTWEDVMLSSDIRSDAEMKRKQQQDISDKQLAEESAMGWWSLGLSILGGALLGPVGYAAGKIIGRGIGDITHDWEKDVVDTGKFYKKEAEEFKKTRDKAATDQTSGQVFNAVTDLAAMYVQAGGLDKGPTDLTTFGSGDAEWSVFGKKGDPFTDTTWSAEGAGGMIHPVTGEAIGSAPMPTGTPGVSSLFSSWKGDEGLLSNLEPITKKVQGAVASGQGTKSSLGRLHDISRGL